MRVGQSPHVVRTVSPGGDAGADHRARRLPKSFGGECAPVRATGSEDLSRSV